MSQKETQFDKIESLEPDRSHPENQRLTTDQGIPIAHTDDSLKAGPRGPTLMEDFHFREKLTHFDHERIPERVVHARGSGAHGYFQVYEPMSKYTRAGFLQDPSQKTPVFVRFSTVGGSRGSADSVRDARGFATKFYTQEGNFDLVGNNIPVFFIQDGIKFPDVVHSFKPEPHNEIPQASTAHDSFWDFVSLVPETAHMVCWVLSDRGIPRSFRMMEGFGVHTFRLVNDAGESHFVKFHWKPLLGVHSLVWEEAQKIAGVDPDYHRRDLWDCIEAGMYPEYELGMQIMTEQQAQSLGFDILDATKLVPEEMIPVQRVGKMTLNRNPDNFFAETEQVAFHIGNLVPGIDVTEDPLLQARLFSYLDTQLLRLGGPNFTEIPINKPLAPVHNHQQDGYKRHTINAGRANYHPNSIGGGCPMLTPPSSGGYVSYPQATEGTKTRKRSESFSDHFSQAKMFFNSLTPIEQMHLLQAAKFEVGKVQRKEVRERVVKEIFANIDVGLASELAKSVGVAYSPPPAQAPGGSTQGPAASPALSIENTAKNSILGRMIALLAADGVTLSELLTVRQALQNAQAKVVIISNHLGPLATTKVQGPEAEQTFLTAASVLFDAIYVPGGQGSIDTLLACKAAQIFIEEAFRHYKPIGAMTEGASLIQAALHNEEPDVTAPGMVYGQGENELQDFSLRFIAAIAQHRHWARRGYPQ